LNGSSASGTWISSTPGATGTWTGTSGSC
jgi:hypothetical protein